MLPEKGAVPVADCTPLRGTLLPSVAIMATVVGALPAVEALTFAATIPSVKGIVSVEKWPDHSPKEASGAAPAAAAAVATAEGRWPVGAAGSGCCCCCC